MSEVGVPFKERSIDVHKFKIPPLPDIPTPTPEVPPPGEPVPYEPLHVKGQKQEQVYTCPICGMTFNSEDELRLHMITNHPGTISQTENKK